MKPAAIIGLSTITALALSMIVTVTASAETFLLAEWAINGATIATTASAFESGEIELKDTSAGIGIICSMELDGTIGPNGEGKISSVLSLAGTEATLSAPLLCKSVKFCEESSTDIEASPEALPWQTLLELMENGSMLNNISSYAYYTSCLVLGIKVSEICTSSEAGYEVKNASGGVEAVGRSEPKASCETGGTSAGILEFRAGNIMTSGSGELTVVSE